MGFFSKKIDFWLQNSKFPAKKLQLLKTQPFLNGVNDLIQRPSGGNNELDCYLCGGITNQKPRG